MVPVAQYVLGYLHAPIGDIGLWSAAPFTAIVPVPKTTMHENDLPAAREHKIRFAGKIGTVYSIS